MQAIARGPVEGATRAAARGPFTLHLLFLSLLALLTAACSKSDAPAEPAAPAASASTAPAQKAFTVGFIYVGSKGDYGYNQAHARGAAVVAAIPGIKIREEENVPETEDVQKTMESMIELDGASVIFPTSFGYFDPHILKVAQKYPKVTFLHCGGLYEEGKHPANVGSYFGYIDEGQYVAGIVAGMTTKTNKLGFIAAKPIPQVLRNINSFTLGARSVNPKVTTSVVFTGDWSLPVKEADAANSLADQGVDVLTMHVDSPKVIVETAEKRGIYVSGYHANQSTLAPKGYLTGAEWNWGKVYSDYVGWIKSGQSYPHLLRGGFKEGFITMSPYGPAVSDAAKAKADAAKAKLTDGTLVIYTGPIKDNTGKVVIPAGTVQTQKDIQLEKMNYLVEGVIGKIRHDARSAAENSVSTRDSAAPPIGVHTQAAAGDLGARLAVVVESIAVPVAGIAVSFVLFGVFVALAGASVTDVYYQMYRGAFGSSFSLQNTLVRAAPLTLTALCTALPAQLGLVVIGGEGALVLGALAAVVAAHAVDGAGSWVVLFAMAAAAALVGGGWIAAQGALRTFRGVNETISSLLLNYIAIGVFKHLVEGPMRDPASLNKPSTRPIGEANALGNIPGMDVHWGLVYGVVACVAAYVLMRRTAFGFAAKVIGGNARAALLSGLAVHRIVIITCALAGGAAGLAGMAEVAAVHGTANASLIVGYGYTGILVAFLARQHPLAILPVAVLIGGIGASGGLLQRTEHLPDAAVNVLQGILFVVILASETLRGRLAALLPRLVLRSLSAPARTRKTA